MKYYGKSAESVGKLLKTDFAQGLTDKEAKRRLRHYGRNNIFEIGKRTPSRVLYGLVYDPVSIILLVSALVCFSYSSFVSAIIIVSVWLINNLITILAYYKAESVFYTIKSYGIPKVKILRDGKIYMVDSRLLVPGDVVMIEAGDIVCADCKIVRADNLYAYENDLCGTKEPQLKLVSDDEDAITLSDMRGMLFASSSIVSGYGVAVVTATSHNTEIVSTAGLIPLTGKHDPDVFYDIKKKCRTWGLFSTSIVIILFIVKMLLDPSDIFGAFMIIVALLGASMTESLLPLTQIVCAQNIAHNAQFSGKGRSIIKNLGIIEDLRDISYLVTTDEIANCAKDDLTEAIDNTSIRLFICAPKNKAFALATRLGISVSTDIDECLHTGEKIRVFVADNIRARLELIKSLKTKGKVGALTSRLDSIRTLSVADVAFTYGKFKYKTSDMSKITLEGIRSTQNQILSRVSDVICEETIVSVKRAASCAYRIFSSISCAATYLITTQFMRVVFSAVTMFSNTSYIEFSDILVLGMILDLITVFYLSLFDGIDCRENYALSHSLISSVVRALVISSLTIGVSYVATVIPGGIPTSDIRALCYITMLLYPLSFMCSATTNRTKQDKRKIALAFLFIAGIISLLYLASPVQQFFGLTVSPISIGAASLTVIISHAITYFIERYISVKY